MSESKLIATLAFFAIFVVLQPLQAALTDGAEPNLPRPSAELQPQDVVRTVINALAQNDTPYTDAGIATTFSFASPANKVNTGPLDKFIRMVKGPPYGIMVDHVKSEFSEVVTAGNNAYQLVRLTGANGKDIVFAFRLSKQHDGEFEGMWMTDAVWPVSPEMVPQQSF